MAPRRWHAADGAMEARRETRKTSAVRQRFGWPATGTFVMSAILLTLGVYLLYPIALIIGLSFNTNPHFFIGDRSWGLDNWRVAFSDPKIVRALWNTIWLFFVAQAISFPLSIFIFMAAGSYPPAVGSYLGVFLLGELRHAGRSDCLDHVAGSRCRHRQ